MEYRKLCNTADELEGNRLLGILSTAGIPAYRMDSGSGQYLKIVMGYNVYGQDIYVDADQFDKAQELASEYMTNEEPSAPHRSKSSIIIARIVLVIVIACAVASVLYNLL